MNGFPPPMMSAPRAFPMPAAPVPASPMLAAPMPAAAPAPRMAVPAMNGAVPAMQARPAMMPSTNGMVIGMNGVIPTPMHGALPAMHAAPATPSDPTTVTVACMGDSLTMWGYPAVLQKLLDEAARISNTVAKWKVLDLGKGGAGIGTATTIPYAQQQEFQRACTCRADIAIICLGTNDAKAGVWECGGREQGFVNGYIQLVRTFMQRARPSAVMLLIPPPLYKDGSMAMSQAVINGVLPQLITQIGAQLGVPVIDVFSEFGGNSLSKPELFEGDGVHYAKPEGYTALARFLLPEVYRAGKPKVDKLGLRDGPPLPPPEPPKPPPPPPPQVFLNGQMVSSEVANQALAAAQAPIKVSDLMPKALTAGVAQQSTYSYSAPTGQPQIQPMQILGANIAQPAVGGYYTGQRM